MTLAELVPLMPLVILVFGILVVLLLGAFVTPRYGIFVGFIALVAAGAWAVKVPVQAGGELGLVFSPFAKFFLILFCAAGAATLLLSAGHNRRLGL